MTDIGARLKKLRIENGYSQRQVAEYLEIDQSNLSKIENNKRKLNWMLSDKLLSLYNCSPEYLLGETDVYIKPRISFKSNSGIDLNAVSKINRLSYHLNVLRELGGEKSLVELPKLNDNLKRKWGLDDYSPIDVATVLHQNIPNLTIVWFPMKMDVSAACFKNDVDSIILLNSSHPIARQNLSLAHELYHLLNNEENKALSDFRRYHDLLANTADRVVMNERADGVENQDKSARVGADGLKKSARAEKENNEKSINAEEPWIGDRKPVEIFLFVCSINNQNEIEKEADKFASRFIMSDQALYDFMERNNIEKWAIEDVVKCGQYFKLDHGSLLHRLLDEELISGSQFLEFSDDVCEKASILGYDTSLYEESKDDKKYYSIGNIIHLADRLCKENKIAKSRRDEILIELFREDIVY